jgi:hypothetical protein
MLVADSPEDHSDDQPASLNDEPNSRFKHWPAIAR